MVGGALLRPVLAILLLTACGADSTPPTPATSGGPVSPQARDVCDESEVGLVEVLGTHPERRAACFGGRSISFRAYVSSMMGVGHVPEQLSPGDGWLDLYATPRRLLVAVPGEDQQVLAALIPPTMSQDDVPMDRWAVVTGHFADPASDTCGRITADGHVNIDSGTVAACRGLFVLESVQPG